MSEDGAAWSQYASTATDQVGPPTGTRRAPFDGLDVLFAEHSTPRRSFEAAAAAIAAFRQQGWAADAFTANARLRVEVHSPPTVHEVSLKAVEQWRRSPSPSPKERSEREPYGSVRCS